MDVTELKQKIADLKNTFDGFAWDSGAGSAGYNKAIDDTLALFPDGPALPECESRTLLRKMIQALDANDHDLYFDTFMVLSDRIANAIEETEKELTNNIMEIPEKFLPLPPVPEGFTKWEPRGYGWKQDNVTYANREAEDGRWYVLNNTEACGSVQHFYIEAV